MAIPQISSSRAAFGSAIDSISTGYLLGGSIKYSQPRRGFRSGIEPVLLASAIPASAGERVLEGGTGTGPALLCLAARISRLCGVGIERDPVLADLARKNLATNGLSGEFEIVTADVTTCPDLDLFNHAFANPPWHSPQGTASSTPGARSAKRATPGSLEAWALSLALRLRRGGTLTMILPAALSGEGCRAIESAGCGSLVLLPLWPKLGLGARLLLVQATKSGAGKCRVLPGLTLHREEGGYSEVLHAILCHGAAIVL